MMGHSFMLVAMGGFMGAIARFGISNWLKKRYPSSFPIATLFINLTGAFLLGFLIGRETHPNGQLLWGTGFMGAFTTFSTFKLESIQLYHKKEWRRLASYLGISYTLGIFLAFLGIRVGEMI